MHLPIGRSSAPVAATDAASRTVAARLGTVALWPSVRRLAVRDIIRRGRCPSDPSMVARETGDVDIIIVINEGVLGVGVVREVLAALAPAPTTTARVVVTQLTHRHGNASTTVAMDTNNLILSSHTISFVILFDVSTRIWFTVTCNCLQINVS